MRYSLVVTHCQALKNFLCFVPQLIQKHRYIFGENRAFLEIYYCVPEIYGKCYFIRYIFSFQVPSSSLSVSLIWFICSPLLRRHERLTYFDLKNGKVCDRNISSKCVPCVTLNYTQRLLYSVLQHHSDEFDCT